MKKVFIILSCILVTGGLFAQKASGTNVDYEYYRLPLQKVAEKKYHFSVEIGYVKDYEADMAFYEEAHAAYDMVKKELNDAYDKALEDYNNQSTGDKIVQRVLLSDDGKPIKPTNKNYADRLNSQYKHFLGPAPYYNLVSPERSDIPTNSEMTSAIKLNGFTKSTSDGLKIVLDATDFSETSETRKLGEAPNETKETNFTVSCEVMVSIVNSQGEEVYANTYAKTLKYKSAKKKLADWSKYERSSAYKNLPNTKKKSLIAMLVKDVNTDLNNQFGYSWIKKRSKIYSAKGKKYFYDDLDKAVVSFQNGLKDLKVNQDVAAGKLNSAIVVWNKALEELDLADKKARINNKIGAALYINLGLAYTLINEFDNADRALSTVQSNKSFKGGDIKEAASVRKFMSDQRIRAVN
tara:strand:+ start:2228 stop:3451 length:1224 start_codon:yes stop_codon:yes gene_type:complete